MFSTCTLWIMIIGSSFSVAVMASLMAVRGPPSWSLNELDRDMRD
jgi:hypothetical protein